MLAVGDGVVWLVDSFEMGGSQAVTRIEARRIRMASEGRFFGPTSGAPPNRIGPLRPLCCTLSPRQLCPLSKVSERWHNPCYDAPTYSRVDGQSNRTPARQARSGSGEHVPFLQFRKWSAT